MYNWQEFWRNKPARITSWQIVRGARRLMLHSINTKNSISDLWVWKSKKRPILVPSHKQSGTVLQLQGVNIISLQKRCLLRLCSTFASLLIRTWRLHASSALLPNSFVFMRCKKGKQIFPAPSAVTETAGLYSDSLTDTSCIQVCNLWPAVKAA